MSSGNGPRTLAGRLRRAAVAAGLVCVSVLAALLLAELLVRLLAPQPIMPRFVESAPWGIRKNLAFVDGFHQTSEFEYRITTNSQGFRGRSEYGAEPPGGTLRIAVLGDSVALGHGVADDQTFSAALERLLHERGNQAEVINMGVSGFGTAEELIQYRHVAAHFNPHVVVVAYFQNDQVNNMVSGLFRLDGDRLAETAGAYQPGVYLRDRLSRIPLYGFLAQHSHLLNFVRSRISAMVLDRYVKESFSAETVRYNAADDRSTGLTRALLKQLVAEITASGSAAIILDIASRSDGFKTNLPRDLELPPRAVIVDATPHLKAAAERGETIYYTIDGHPTAAGHAAIAHALLAALPELAPGL